MRHVPTLIATSYQMSLITGRTMPGVFICEDANGNSLGEYVVKLRHNIETGNAGLLREIAGNLLAEQLGLEVPEAAIVRIEPGLAKAIPEPRVAESVRGSVGLNFGSKNLAGGYQTWPKEKIIPASMRQAAIELFVFDALIHNPDRTSERPNLFWKGDQLFLFDHDQAFSFLLAIPKIKVPWDLSEQPYLREHVFFNGLRHAQLDLDGMVGAIETVSDDFWDALEKVVPNEWKGSELSRIRSHIESVQQHLDDFMNNVRRILQ
ncbi:MAG: hypothetical protein HY707_11150 [Ignavibacteriae bacterium]|nr:hypothetical protein [Ignavibacteriota bacterium]